MLSDDLPDMASVKQRYAIPFDDYIILMYHPVTTDIAALPGNIGSVVDSVMESGLNAVVIYPNNDTGAAVIMRELQRFKDNPRFRLLPSMRFESFLTLLKHAKAIVGNSSAGIREAPVYGVPTVNIGTRQMNRARHGGIMNVPEDKTALLSALRNLPARMVPSYHFGRGASAEHFLDVLKSDVVWKISAQKHFRDL